MEIRKTNAGKTEVKFRGAWVDPDNRLLGRETQAAISAMMPQRQANAAANKANQGVVNDKPNQPPQPRPNQPPQPPQPAPPQGPIDINTRGIKPLGEAQPQSNLRTLTDGILGVSSPEPLEMPVFADMADNYQDVEMPEAIDLGSLTINRLGTSGLGLKAEQDQIMSGLGGTGSMDTLINGLNDSLKRRVR
jgi:hypothetical protein